jgi:hypothetical protein
MTNFLDAIHRLSLIRKTHDISETGFCLFHQVKKDTHSVDQGQTMDMSEKFVILTTNHRHKPSEFIYLWFI